MAERSKEGAAVYLEMFVRELIIDVLTLSLSLSLFLSLPSSPLTLSHTHTHSLFPLSLALERVAVISYGRKMQRENSSLPRNICELIIEVLSLLTYTHTHTHTHTHT